MNPGLAAALLLSSARAETPKAVFEKVCGTCHATDVVTGLGNTREGWNDLVNEMLLRGGSATPPQRKQIVGYLAQHYPLRREPGDKR